MTDIYEEDYEELYQSLNIEEKSLFSEEKKKTKRKPYKTQKEKETQAKIDEENALNFWRAVLTNPTGRREIWNILQNDTKAFEDRFGCGPNGFPNPEASWFHAGEKAVGMRFYIKLMSIDPQSIVLMHSENDHRVMK